MIRIHLFLFMLAAVQPSWGEQGARRFILEPLEHALIQGPATVAFSRDLDGDEVDELVYIKSFPSDDKTRYMLMIEHTSSRDTRSSMVLPTQYHPAIRNALDVNADGSFEITMSYVRNDTVFIAVFDTSARPMAEVPVFTKRDSPWISMDSPPDWIPGIPPEDTLDCNGDRYPDLICVGGCGYWEYPRGVWAVDWAHERVLWHYAAGSKFEDAVTITDTAGIKRIVAASNSGATGREYNNTSARESCLAVLARDGSLVRLHVMAHEKHHATRIGCITSTDSSTRLLSITACGNLKNPKPARILLWEGAADRVIAETTIDLIDTDINIADIDMDGVDEFMVTTPSGYLALFGADVRMIDRIAIGSGRMVVTETGDITGDGLPEVIINMRSGIAVIDPRSADSIAQRSDMIPCTVVRPGHGAMSSVLAKKSEDYIRLSLQANPDWVHPQAMIFHPGVVVGLGTGIMVLFFGVGRLISRRTTFPENGMIAAAAVGADGSIISANSRFFRFFGIPPGEMCNRPIPVLLTSLKVNPENAYHLLQAESGRWISMEIAVDSERKYIRCRLSSKPTKRSPALLEIVSDHEGSDQKSGIGWAILAPRVAHNMKSPLSTLLLGTERAVRSAEAGRLAESDAGRILDTILHQVERIDGIARNFLKLAELERPDMTLVDPDSLIGAAVDMLRERKPGEISVEITIKDRLPTLRADEEQLLIVLENIFENSIAAIEDEGIISIRAYRTTTIPGREDLDGEAVVVEVSDTGSGLDPETKKRIFDVGFTTRRQGSGLGLAIIRHVVELHGGVVEVHSERGIGTTVTVCIPARTGSGS